MKNALTPFRVGLLVLAMIAAFVAFLSLVGGSRLKKSNSHEAFAVFDDATGLTAKSRVQIAGIDVGQIDKIELSGNKARLTLRIKHDVTLKEDAELVKRPESILGDYLLDLNPGSDAAPPLPDGGQIARVHSAAGVEEVFTQLNRITGDIREVTRTLRNVLGGEEGTQSLKNILEGMNQITANLNKTINESGGQLRNILGDVRGFTQEISGLGAGQKNNVQEIVENTRAFTAQARQVLDSVQQIMGAGKTDLKDSVAGIRQTLAKVDKSLDDVQAITGTAKSGQGVVGRLLNDKQLGQRLSDTIKGASEIVDTANRLQTEISERSEIFLGQPGLTDNTLHPWAKNYVTLRIRPQPDKWYGVELIDDPRGYVQVEDVKRTPPSSIEVAQQQIVTTSRALKLSAYIARRFGIASFRFGLLENTGGFGAKLHLLHDDLEVAADAFEFSNPLKSHPRLKLYANWTPYPHLFATAGVDDVFNPIGGPGAIVDDLGHVTAGRDYFLGGGVYFDDKDIGTLVGLLATKF